MVLAPHLRRCVAVRAERTHLQLGSSEAGVRSSGQWRERPLTPELAESLGVWEALAELSLTWRNECGPHSR